MRRLIKAANNTNEKNYAKKKTVNGGARSAYFAGYFDMNKTPDFNFEGASKQFDHRS